jgi:hypothetical protein
LIRRVDQLASIQSFHPNVARLRLPRVFRADGETKIDTPVEQVKAASGKDLCDRVEMANLVISTLRVQRSECYEREVGALIDVKTTHVALVEERLPPWGTLRRLYSSISELISSPT